jgi:hypothetical protein
MVRWSATDPDGGSLDASGRALDATVDFSADGGRSWRTVYEGRSRGAAAVPGGYLQASTRARVRVVISDGFGEATAISPIFRAEGAPPEVQIERPVPGELLVDPGPTRLRGSATDDTGRPLRGKSLTWFAGRRVLGHGERLQVRSLAVGRVNIRLVARDRSGRVSTSNVTIRVRAPQPAIDLLDGKRVVAKGSRSTTLRIRSTAPAVLRVGGRRYAVGPRARSIVVRLPAGPRAGLLSLPYELRNANGRSRGAIEIVRTA